jgi:predicted component of type VI protein secretion system
MQVKLRVLVGKSAGKELAIPVSHFLIGRAKDCHMRPKSDSISRNHCAILTSDDKVVVRDLNSRNGTFVNSERIEGDCELKAGDRLKVGKLEFEVRIKGAAKATKKKEATSEPSEGKPKEAAAAKPNSDSGSIDFDVSEWLDEADALDKARRQAEPDTRQFQLDETDRVQLEQAEGAASEDESQDADSGKKRGRPEKKEPGKLPQRPGTAAATSRDAAADMLKKFFDNR